MVAYYESKLSIFYSISLNAANLQSINSPASFMVSFGTLRTMWSQQIEAWEKTHAIIEVVSINIDSAIGAIEC